MYPKYNFNEINIPLNEQTAVVFVPKYKRSSQLQTFLKVYVIHYSFHRVKNRKLALKTEQLK